MLPSLSAYTRFLGDILSAEQDFSVRRPDLPEDRALQRPSNPFSSVEPRKAGFYVTFHFLW